MPSEEMVFLAYVGGKHSDLGAHPWTPISDSQHIEWTRGVPREVPAELAKRIIQSSPGQFAIVDADTATATSGQPPAEDEGALLLAELAPVLGLHVTTELDGKGAAFASFPWAEHFLRGMGTATELAANRRAAAPGIEAAQQFLARVACGPLYGIELREVHNLLLSLERLQDLFTATEELARRAEADLAARGAKWNAIGARLESDRSGSAGGRPRYLLRESVKKLAAYWNIQGNDEADRQRIAEAIATVLPGFFSDEELSVRRDGQIWRELGKYVADHVKGKKGRPRKR